MSIVKTNSLPPAATSAEIIDRKPTNGVSKNALKHGVYAQEIVVEGESTEEFNSLYASLSDELNPQGPSEEAVVVEVAQLRWIKLRLIRTYAKSKGVQASSPLQRSDAPILSGASQREFRAQFETLEGMGILKSLSSNDLNTTLTPAQSEVLKAVSHGLGGGAAAHDFDLHCTDLERFLKLLAMVETRLQKSMVHLIACKEYKRQYCKEVATSVQEK